MPPAQAAALQAPRVHEAAHLPVLVDAVLIGHRAAEPRGRAPVDLPHVVVGRVLAHRFERGAEPERPPRAAPGFRQRAAADGEREPPRADEVGVDEQVRVGTHPVVPRPEPERPGHAYAHGRQHVTPATPCHELTRECVPALLWYQRHVRGQRLPHAHGTPGRAP